MYSHRGIQLPRGGWARSLMFAAALVLSSWCHATTLCAQVVTWAVNPATGECRQFPTPCDVPSGWQAAGYSGCPATADYDGVWTLSETTVSSSVPFRFFMLRISGGTAVIVLLNSYSWDAYVAAWRGTTAQVTTWDSLGFNRWSLTLDSENSGTIAGESCIGNNGIVPMYDPTIATPSVSSSSVSSLPVIASACRVPAGAKLAVRRLL